MDSQKVEARLQHGFQRQKQLKSSRSVTFSMNRSLTALGESGLPFGLSTLRPPCSRGSHRCLVVMGLGLGRETRRTMFDDVGLDHR